MDLKEGDVELTLDHTYIHTHILYTHTYIHCLQVVITTPERGSDDPPSPGKGSHTNGV